jgi:short-subunit dehydrogenase
MAISLKPLDQQTIVITGASSGIGLSTALMAAERGVNLVLVARSPENLEDAAEQCRAKGAEVETVAADVADAAVLKLVAERATERFGGFDTWVNNAGASVYGRLWDIPEEDARARSSRRTTGAACTAASWRRTTSASARAASTAARSSTSAAC